MSHHMLLSLSLSESNSENGSPRSSALTPSAAPNMMLGVGPNRYPTSISNSNNAMMVHNPTKTHIMSPFPFISGISPVSKPLDSQSHGLSEGSPQGLRASGFSIETEKKKRGRPMKYLPDGNIALGLSSTLVGQGNSGGSPLSDPPTAKKNRGRRPPGSGRSK